MSFFDKKECIYGPVTHSVGDFDPTVDGCYRNVVTLAFDVKPRMMMTVKIKSDNPVDVAVAREDHAAAGHKDQVTDAVLGPYSTEKFKSMGLFLGVYRGDHANVTVEVWLEKE
ncbi:MAG: hypothetical protein IKD00_02635 [Candidatus Methanomethylophilaceae archaeon]|nr:hypothetical protein [Candidatus Methanomethylophilaceae archaeon]